MTDIAAIIYKLSKREVRKEKSKEELISITLELLDKKLKEELL